MGNSKLTFFASEHEVLIDSDSGDSDLYDSDDGNDYGVEEGKKNSEFDLDFDSLEESDVNMRDVSAQEVAASTSGIQRARRRLNNGGLLCRLDPRAHEHGRG